MQDLNKMKQEIKWMQDIIMALIILQDDIMIYKLRNMYPMIDNYLKNIWK